MTMVPHTRVVTYAIGDLLRNQDDPNRCISPTEIFSICGGIDLRARRLTLSQRLECQARSSLDLISLTGK